MKKRILAVLMAVLLVAGFLAACGDSSPTPAPSPSPTTEGTPAPPAGGAPADVTEVTIGALAPLTGPVAQFGEAVQQGVELYIEQFNAQGGLQINVEWFNEEGQAPLGISGYLDLVDRGVTAIIGAVTSGVTMAVVPFAYEDGMPMISGTSTHAGVTVDQDTGTVFTNMFRSCFIDPFQGYIMANFAADVLDAETVGVLYNNENAYSIGLTEAFIEQAEARGLEVIIVETFQNQAVNFAGQLTNIANANPDALFVPYYYESVALMGSQSAGTTLDTVWLGADGWATVLDMMVDPTPLEGAFYLTGFYVGADDPMVRDFVDRFQAAHNMPPNMFAAQAYDAAMILVAAIEAAIADGHEPNTDEFKASVIAHMSATNLTGVTGHITFDQYNNPQKTAFIIEIADGEETYWGSF